MRKSAISFFVAGAFISMLSFSAAPATAMTLPISAAKTVVDHDGVVKKIWYRGYHRPYYRRYYRPYYGHYYYYRPYRYYARPYYYRPYRYSGHYYYRPYRYYRYW